MDPLLDPLNDAQREAVRHIDGPMLVLAGPGSGKTRVVTNRIGYMLREGIPPSQILALTFTNKAAEEMRNRVEQLASHARVWVSTFHRFGARLLRQYAELVGLTPNFTIYDMDDARATLRRAIESEKIRTAHYTPDRIASAISAAKNQLVTSDKFQPRVGSPLSHIVAEVYPAYQRRLLASSAVDFDDLLLHVATLLYQNAEVRAELDARYRYILVDEYQDTNRAQYVIVRAMSMDAPNLAATGDPDQSIYGWRGADLNNILQFESDFKDVKVVRLEQNYRSTQAVLRVADQLIRCNVRRKPKELFTSNGPGAPVRLVQYANQDDEARGIAQRIAADVAAGRRRPRDFAIFYRVNALSRSLERALHEAGVPYQMIRGQEFYQRKEIKDVLAYCQLAVNPRDDQALLRAINTPARGIGRKTLERLAEHAYQCGGSMLDAARHASQVEGIAKPTAAKAMKFAGLIDKLGRLSGGPVEEVLGVILAETDYRKQLADSESEDDLNRLANIEELLTDARQFDETHGEGQLETYLENAWLVNETDDWQAETDKATMMTLHAAKGLEFPVVFIVAVEQGLLPHERSINAEDQLEEERRLAFVGITRAKEELQLSYAVHRDFRGQRRRTVPSQFLLEAPRGEMELVSVGSENWYPAEWDDDLGPHDEHDGVDAGHAGDAFEGLQGNELELSASRPAGGASSELAMAAVSSSSSSARSRWSEAAATITTAARLAGDEPDAAPRPAPESFVHDMRVIHPEHGLGRIVALSGRGDKRTATVPFVAAGERRFVLALSPLRPVGK